MVVTTAQTTAFFENPDQMGIPHAMVIQLQVEGITGIQDLTDFDKDTLQQLADNLRKLAGYVLDAILLQLRLYQHLHLCSVQNHSIA